MNQNSSVSPASSPQRGLLPLTIGVTGHRDLRLQDVPALEAHITRILGDLQIRYPNTPLLVLSSLAEGADQLAARVALQSGAQLMVPLPMPSEELKDTFSGQSRTNFDDLLARAQTSFVVPDGNDSSENTPAQRFALAGAFIAAHCNLMLAFWDGESEVDANHIGGTAHAVQFRLQGAPDEYAPQRDILDAPDTGPLWHIVTPRNGKSEPQNALSCRELLPPDRQSEEFERVRERLETFNRDTVQLDGKLKSAREQSRGWMLPPTEQENLPSGARRLLDFYAIADSLALHFATLTRRTMNRIFLFVLLAAACFNIFHSLPVTPHGAAHGPADSADAAHHSRVPGHLQVLADVREEQNSNQTPLWAFVAAPASSESHATATSEVSWGERLKQVPWFLLLSLGASAFCTWAIYQPARRGEYQNKHQDYRALAEGLRVQFFWDVSGISESAADHYLNKQRGELAWIQNALRIWHLSSLDQNGAIDERKAQHGLQMTQQFWVEEQRKYFAGKAHREHHQLERDEGFIARLIGLSAALALALMLILVLPLLVPAAQFEAVKHWIEGDWPHGLVMLAIVMLAVGGGLLHGFNQQQARAEHSKQFARMSVLFDNAAKRLESVGFQQDSEASRRLIRALGREALAENGDWVLLHRERPLEVPHAG